MVVTPAAPVLVRIAATDAIYQVTPTSDKFRVSDLKAELNRTAAFPAKKQTLSVNGKKLKDKQIVSDVCDPTQDIIDLSVAIKGGCCGCDLDCCCCDVGCCI